MDTAHAIHLRPRYPQYFSRPLVDRLPSLALAPSMETLQYCPQPAGMYPAVTLPLQQVPPGFLRTMYPSTRTPFLEIPSIPQQVVGVPRDIHHHWAIDPALLNLYPSPAPVSAAPASVPASVPAPMPAFRAPGQAYVASGWSGAPTATQEKPKRKRSRKDPTSVLAPNTSGNEALAVGAASATAPKRHKGASKANTSTNIDVPPSSLSSGAAGSADDDDLDSPVGPESPDWDMWIRGPSTTKGGPSVKQTLVAGKSDWKTPVQRSAVPADKQAQAIRRLLFWMQWNYDRAIRHLEERLRKWISEKKRQASDKENPGRTKRARKAKAPVAATTVSY
ncbi:Protein of unknown function [Pyronema omphalodes CBS 100304]|uniref:Uncharacterized protein n=1 Tax=Pyronema omphalodes (strain CBS 100304) TaxID=1076935 RepID=U4LHQ0_PYROM|nr:Protein of unknown function [Pyronema omphalodes CBS 100304]